MPKVRVPDSIYVQVGDDSNARSVQVLVTGEGFRALKAEVEYVLNNLAPGCTVLRNRFSYEGSERRFGNGWQLDVNLVANRFDMLFECGGLAVVPLGYCPPYMGLSRIELHLLVGNDTWDPPGGILDPHIVSLPTTMTNVENGYGFIGAGYRTVETFQPSDETLQKACFAYEQ